MYILGTLGYADDTTASATYGNTIIDRGNFFADALTVGFSIEVHTGVVIARNEKGLVSGEWTETDGGMLAWSVK